MLYYWHNTLNQQLEPCSGFSVWYRFFCWSIFPCNLNSFYSSSPFHSSPSVTFSLFLSPFQKSISSCHLFVCFCPPSNSVTSVCCPPVFSMFSSVYVMYHKVPESTCECLRPAVQRLKPRQNFSPAATPDDDWESSEEWQAFITQWTHILTPFLTAGLSSPLVHLHSQAQRSFWPHKWT